MARTSRPDPSDFATGKPGTPVEGMRGFAFSSSDRTSQMLWEHSMQSRKSLASSVASSVKSTPHSQVSNLSRSMGTASASSAAHAASDLLHTATSSLRASGDAVASGLGSEQADGVRETPVSERGAAVVPLGGGAASLASLSSVQESGNELNRSGTELPRADERSAGRPASATQD